MVVTFKHHCLTLNFGDFGIFSPLKIRSAPMFLPSLGQPYLAAQPKQQDTKVTKSAALPKILFINIDFH
jgi:hypothetical protein